MDMKQSLLNALDLTADNWLPVLTAIIILSN